jgi:hypothetical protein
MVLFQGGGICVLEGDGKLVGGFHVRGDGDAGEFEAADEPEQAFGGGVLLGFELIEDEGLESLGFGGGSELAITDFLGEEVLVSVVQRCAGVKKCDGRLQDER